MPPHKPRHQYRFVLAAALEPLEVDPAALGGTIAGLNRAALAAGFRTRCFTGFGPRIPKLPAQPYRWQEWTTLSGSDGAWGFAARTDDEGWTVTLRRPGWPDDPHTSTTTLRAVFAARVPAVMAGPRR